MNYFDYYTTIRCSVCNKFSRSPSDYISKSTTITCPHCSKELCMRNVMPSGTSIPYKQYILGSGCLPSLKTEYVWGESDTAEADKYFIGYAMSDNYKDDNYYINALISHLVEKNNE